SGSRTTVAPASFAACTRCGIRSTAMIGAAPIIFAVWMIDKPSGPAPITATLEAMLIGMPIRPKVQPGPGTQASVDNSTLDSGELLTGITHGSGQIEYS